MTTYIAIIDHDGATFGASFPDAPGCTAMGTTEDEVFAHAAEALAEWVLDEIAEGRKPPEPRTYLQLLQSGQYGLGEGGMIARVPLLLETGRNVRVNISIDAGLLASIDEAADKQSLTRSAFLAAAARTRVKQVA